MSHPHEPLTVDATGLAALLNVSRRHIVSLDTTNQLPRPIRLGRSVRWSVREVEYWIAAGAPDRATWESDLRSRRTPRCEVFDAS